MPTTNPDPMLSAILRLTTVHTEAARKPDSIVNHYAKHAAMLQQLRMAVGGNVKGGGAGGKSPNQRTPIDPDALDRYLSIVNAIRDFHRLYVGSRPDVDELPEVTLSRAFQSFQSAVAQGIVTPAAKRSAESWAEGVCTQIEEKLSPPTRLELANFPCPECGIDWVLKVVNRSPKDTAPKEAWIDKERLVAISIVYRSGDGIGMLGKSYALCSCCETVWEGDYGVRFVAHEFGAWVASREPDGKSAPALSAEQVEAKLIAGIEAAARPRSEQCVRGAHDGCTSVSCACSCHETPPHEVGRGAHTPVRSATARIALPPSSALQDPATCPRCWLIHPEGQCTE